tara:strand:- start:102 stop:302 length:201 start_codon:yes stop_codon:yes gene_type:complete
MSTAAFYRYENNYLADAVEIRHNGKTYYVNNHADYSYPIDGFTYYASIEEACAAFGISVPDATTES